MPYDHNRYAREWMARRRARWVARGLCGSCGADPGRFKACLRCRIQLAAACKRWRQKVKAVA